MPTSAISRIGGETFVFIAKPAKPAKNAANSPQMPPENPAKPAPPAMVAEQRQIVLGEIQGNAYQVINGLQPGEKLVTAGIAQLREGSTIQPLPSK